MKFTKYNNPSHKKKTHKMSRTDADIVAAKMSLDNPGVPLNFYDEVSDKLCGKESRR